MKKLFKKFFNKIFAPKATVQQSPLVTNKHIQKMHDLKGELSAIDSGFSKKLVEKEQEYDTVSMQYEEAYKAYAELFKKHRKGLVGEAEVMAEKAKLKPLEMAVNAVREELDTITQYKHEEILSLLNSMQALQDDYVKAKAEELKFTASHLKRIKLEYKQRFDSYILSAKEVMETEKVMQYYFKRMGFHKKIAMSEKLNAMLKDVPERFE
ncbi:hypothetical protein ACIQ2D_21400 [Lysinibacillus sp. NPDC097287]|uniref:hypothetical protein n=1 Tax=Lysinibacillus sp. NPDC097287 TaxID=3364144 RepID=UPI00381D3268